MSIIVTVEMIWENFWLSFLWCDTQAKAYYRKAQALEALGKDVEALALWRQALKHQPEDAQIRRKLRAAAPRAQSCWGLEQSCLG